MRIRCRRVGKGAGTPVPRGQSLSRAVSTRRHLSKRLCPPYGVTALAALVLATTPALADSVEDFYQGRTISLIIASGEGGGYDISGRLVADHLSKFIPGHPTVIARNMPGASGMRAADYMHNVAAQDGIHPSAGVLSQNHIANQLRRRIHVTRGGNHWMLSFVRTNHGFRALRLGKRGRVNP